MNNTNINNIFDIKTIVTPKGTAMWSHLDKPEIYKDKVVGYTITFVLSKADAEDLQKELESILEEAKKNPTFKGRVWSPAPLMGMKEDADGNIVFKFKKKTHYEDKQGVTHPLSVPVFDSVGNQMDPAIVIGNGSIIKVAFKPVPFNNNRNINGLSLRLEAVQVLDLKEYGKGTGIDMYGFQKEENNYVTQEVFKKYTEPASNYVEEYGDSTDF